RILTVHVPRHLGQHDLELHEYVVELHEYVVELHGAAHDVIQLDVVEHRHDDELDQYVLVEHHHEAVDVARRDDDGRTADHDDEEHDRGVDHAGRHDHVEQYARRPHNHVEHEHDELDHELDRQRDVHPPHDHHDAACLWKRGHRSGRGVRAVTRALLQPR